MTCSNTCREQIFLQKKMAVLKRWQVVASKSRFFIANKGVDLSLDVWPLRKVLKPFLQNICLLLDLLYKRKPFITIAIYGSIFEKILKNSNLREKG